MDTNVMIPTTIQLSIQQEKIIHWVTDSKGSLIINAYAGTGKTSTLMEIAKVIKGNGFMGAFNKAIADEFKGRLARQGSHHVKGSTLHSAGLAAWTKVAGQRVEVNSRKLESIVKSRLPKTADYRLWKVVRDAVAFGKQACFGVEGAPKVGDRVEWLNTVEYYDLQEELQGLYPQVSVEDLISYAIDVYQDSLERCKTEIDFDDMLLAPLYYGAAFQKYDWVMIDECQDTNMARRMIAFKMLGPNSRMVAVGDRHQAIYGFAGANADSMDRIAEQMEVRGEFTELPLSVTYRCPKSVVKVAQSWVPKFEAHSENPQGLVTHMSHTDFFNQTFMWNDAILCRNTRPLVGIADRLRDAGVACVVEGNTGRGLKKLAERWGGDLVLDAFLERLEGYEAEEVGKWEKKDKLDKVEFVKDRCATLRDMVGRMSPTSASMPWTTRSLVQRIEMLFGENSQNVLRLCTIHRAKGREWNRVYLIGRNRYMPSPYAKKEWEMAQEDNLAYVAVTRAKVELVEVNVPFIDKRKEQEWWEK
jgi:DNA helicase II / ATP-dependent DNA helicase PcrA